MRIVLDNPRAVAPDTYQRFIQRAQIEALMPDHLVEGEPYLAPNAIVLDQAESDRLCHLTSTFASAFRRAGEVLMADRALMEGWGFPWLAAELLAIEQPRMPLVGRFDFLADTDGGWWLLEFNADTPSGVREAIAVDTIAHDMVPGANALARPNKHMAAALTSAFQDAFHILPSKRHRLGLVTNTAELEDLSQMAFTQDLLREPLARSGIEVVLGDADNLRATRSGLSLCGRPIGALYRYLSFESILGSSPFAAIADASAAGHVELLNGLFGLLLQHKGLLAWLWAHRDDPRFPENEREAICRHLPPTWMITERPGELPAQDLVAKQFFGREGAEVMFAADIAPEDWRELRRRRTYVVQRRISPPEQDALVWTSLGPSVQRGSATVGSFAIRGEWAGYYTRFGGKIITSRAKWLATFVE